MLGVLVAACGGGGGDSGKPALGGLTTLFTSAPAAVTIDVGRAAEYSISGGRPPYLISSSDLSAVTAGMSGDAAFMISGVKGGTATVTVKDSAGAAVALAVTVGSGTALFTTAPAQVALAVGATETFNIGGGSGPFSVASANGATATAALNTSGTAFTVSGQKSGSTAVVVSDSRGATVSINVTVGTGQVPLFTSAASPVVIGVGTVPVYSIGGGTGPYVATSSNETVARASTAGNTVSISGLASGTANVQISDAVGGRVSLSVTVGSADVVALYTTSPANIVLAKGAPAQSFSIGGGVGPYTASSGNSTVVSSTVSGAKLSLEGLGVGSTTVSVFDSQGRTTPISVTVSASNPLNVTAPESLTLTPGTTGSYQISGGVAPYQVIGSNSAVVSVASSGNTFSIGALLPGSAQLTVRDSTGVQKLIAVTVSPSQALFVSSAPAVSLPSGTTSTFVVGGGVPSYTVSSSNTAVVTANLSGTTLTLNAVGTGSATVVVRDAAGATQSVAVTAGPAVALFTTAPGSITVGPASTQAYSVGGGVAPYTATSSNTAVATASVSGNTLTVNGLVSGTATVSLRDALGVAIPLAVTVSTNASQALTVSPAGVSGAVGDSLTVLMFGGDPAYSVVPTNPAVASLAQQTSNRFVLNLLKAGSTSVVVADSRGQVQNLTVTVVAAPVTPLGLSVPPQVTLPLGAVRTVLVSGGVAPYRVGSSNESVLAASVAGSVVTLTPVASGTATVAITDGAGSAVTITATVGSSVDLFTTAPASLNVGQGTSQTFSILGGRSPYFVSSGNPASVSASVAGSVLTITGVSPGNGAVAIRDSIGATVSIAVTVGNQTPLFTSAPANVVMSAGAQRSFIVDGGSPAFAGGLPVYQAVSNDPAVVTSALVGNTLTLNSLSGGTAQIVITDSLGARTSFQVTVGGAVALHTTAPATVTVSPGVLNAQTYEIRGGASPYTVTSGNVAVATVNVAGNLFTITGIGVGSANLQVTDRLGATVPIAVAVASGAAAPLAVTPLAATGTVGDVVRFEIRGGTPVYTATVANQNVAAAAAFGTATAFTVQLTAIGSSNIAVIDSLGQIQNVSVTAQNNVLTPLFTSAPALASLAVGVPQTFTVGGGSGSYLFASSDPAVVTVPATSSTQLVLTPAGIGTATVSVTDSAGSRVSFNVVVGGVQPLRLSPGAAVTLGLSSGATTYGILGGRTPYTAVSTNASVVTVASPGASSNLILTPVAAGAANVVVTDAAGTQVSLAVTVAQSGVQTMTVSPTTASANVGDVLAFAVTGGTSPYSFTVNNSSVATLTSVSPGPSPGTFRMDNAGSTTITVTDAAGQVQQVTLTVTQSATQLRLSPTTLILPETYQLGVSGAAGNLLLNIYGGASGFSAYTTDPVRTAVSIVNGNQIRVSRGSSGTLCSNTDVTRYAISGVAVTDPTQPAAANAFDVVITVVDNKGASATAKLVIIDDGLNTDPLGDCR